MWRSEIAATVDGETPPVRGEGSGKMQKSQVDKIITKYMKKIYGFSFSKTRTKEETEELTSRITFEVYKTLLKKEEIHNINSYIYRISNNVYAKFVNDLNNERIFTNMDNSETFSKEDKSILKHKNFRKLINEIAYLGRLQREIVVLHYFHKEKLKNIAERLNLPLGTVKRHIFEARNNLKEGFNEDNKLTFTKNLITFTTITQYGQLGPIAYKVPYFLNDKLPQNILYSIFRKAKTSVEIAKELSVSTIYIEDEINHLINNGFINKVPGNKFFSNIYINEQKDEKFEKKIQEILFDYVEEICNKYIPIIFNTLTKNNYFQTNGKIYTPLNDKNFLMWAIITYICGQKFYNAKQDNKLEKYKIKRPDDSKYITITEVKHDTEIVGNVRRERINAFRKICEAPCFTEQINQFPTKMGKFSQFSYVSPNQTQYPFKIYSFTSYFDKREKESINVPSFLFELLYDFIAGRLDKSISNVDKYIRLYNEALVMPNNDYVNIVVTSYSEEELYALIPDIPEELIERKKVLQDKIYDMSKPYYPSHMQELCYLFCNDIMSSAKVKIIILEVLLRKGILKPLKKKQIRTANMIMFCDRLPI